MANFLDKHGLHTFMNSIKMWVITNLNEWWKLLKVGHSYLDSNSYSTDGDNKQWIYSVEAVENTDSATKLKYPLIPKISFHSTDWKYSKWEKTSSPNYFPFQTGPARTMVERTPYPSYYTKSIVICPQYGHISGTTNFTASSFQTMNGLSNQILMGDGSTRTVSTLGNVLKCNVNLKTMVTNNTRGSYSLSNADWDTLNGLGMVYELNFFKTADGVVFERMSRTYASQNWTTGKFAAKYINPNTNVVVDVTAELDNNSRKITFRGLGSNTTNYGEWKWIG